MRTDQDIALDSVNRLHTAPDLDDQDIAIKVTNGVVLLAGIARSDVERALAERIVKRVPGVVGLTNYLTVSPRNASPPPDPDITREAVGTIRHQFPDQVDAVQILVHRGRVVLEGELNWYYQRDLVEAIVRCLQGVTWVTNKIRVSEKSAAPTPSTP